MEEKPTVFLKIDSLTVERSLGFGERGVALRGVSLEVEKNEIHVLGGEVGSGKSILCRLTLGALERHAKILSGSILVDGEDLLAMRNQARRAHRRRELGFIGRGPSEVFNLQRTVLQSLREFSRLSRMGDRVIDEKDWSDVFYSVGIIEPERILPRPIESLSLFMVQKVALMRTLISGAELLILDDATAGLDRVAENQFLELLAQLRESHGLTIVMATGNLRGVERFADHVSVFFEGGLLESRPAADLVRSPEMQYTREFLASSPKLSDRPRELPSISREAIQEAEKKIHGSNTSALNTIGAVEDSVDQ
jgi:ABC-type glutathione transport system ATPase component